MATQETKDAVKEAPKAEKSPEVKVGQKPLAQLIGEFVTRVVADRKSLQQCYRDLQLWYDSQPLEDRKERVRKIKEEIEVAKLTMEALYSQFQIISQKDLV